MDFVKIGQKDGTSQFKMDKLTETKRDVSLLVYTAIQSEHFGMALNPLSIAEYVGGFVAGYLIARQAEVKL